MALSTKKRRRIIYYSKLYPLWNDAMIADLLKLSIVTVERVLNRPQIADANQSLVLQPRRRGRRQ